MKYLKRFESFDAEKNSLNEEISSKDIKAFGLAAAMSLGSLGSNATTTSTELKSPESIEQISELPKDTQKQLDWLRKYVMSDMYLKRLEKEFPGKSDSFLKKERQTRYDNLKNMEYRTKFVKSIGSEPGWISGVYTPKKGSGEFKTNKGWGKDDFTKDKKSGTVELESEYGPGKKKPTQGFEHIPAHEFSHALDDAGDRISDKTIDKIQKLTKPSEMPRWRKSSGSHEFDYESTPTEFIGRMQALRYMLAKKGIYDATKEEFSEQHFKKMMSDPDAKEDTHLYDLLKVIKGTGNEQMKNFIELMNSIAKNDTKSDSKNYAVTGSEWRKINKELKADMAALSRKAADGKVKIVRKDLSNISRNLGMSTAKTSISKKFNSKPSDNKNQV
jgi:hypothetical protein